MMTLTQLTIISSLFGVVALSYVYIKKNRTTFPLPPGPRGIPILGNVFQKPSGHEWIYYTELGKKFGPIVHLQLFRECVIILNSRQAAVDLMEKRSALYSDRPSLVMAGELVGWNNGVTLISSGDRHRRYRKYLHGTLSATATKSFWTMQEQGAHSFLNSCLKDPDGFLSHIRRAVTASVVKIAYGYAITSNEDPYVTLAQIAQEQFSVAATPNTYAVDWFPLLKHLPESFPGAGFKRQGKIWREELQHLLKMPISKVKQELLEGTAAPSYASLLLSREGITATDEEEISWSALSLYTGGADTTVSSMATFVLALVRQPQILRRIQVEIDLVTEGLTRLPTFLDRERLPYLEACLMETNRWRPAIPLGVAHRVNANDTYKGMRIPKGATVISNIWAMMHDENIYHNPSDFNPDRFLGEDKDSALAVFGFGRRICPGRFSAQDSLFILAAQFAAVFDVRPKLDPTTGTPLIPPANYTSGLISHPEPFKCEIKPRNTQAEKLIMHEYN